ncbi:biosynthetic-type acetolactate synthase large subunit [Anaerolineales bacterium HSG25]|nr:biosynthetic-type acetolactate synthase large subunit [Anaerolineales bacterium HSG25]
MRTLTGAEIIWECLVQEGVEVVFGYPGGAILRAYDALTNYQEQIHHVLVRHEQGASHMADGYARASGKVGVAVATSGPGATNLVTGLATAMMDSSPIVCITGQAATPVIGKDAFQEVDVVGVTMSVTKHNYLVTDATELADTIREAFHIAKSGRPGPVLIDVPKDVQFQVVEDWQYPTESICLPGEQPVPEPTSVQVETAVEMINASQRPMILAGHGVLISGAMPEMLELSSKGNIPVSTTLLGTGGVPASHPLNLGMMGMHGQAAANHAIQEADLLIACGMRFDDRVTGDVKQYAPHAKKIHIDIDPTEFNKNIEVDLALHSDLAIALRNINPAIQFKGRGGWLHRLRDWQEDDNQRDAIHVSTPVMTAGQAIREIWKGTEGQALVVTDVGQHQMLEAQYYEHEEPRTLLTSGGAGTMGFSLPASIGAWFQARKSGREVWVIVGDGSIQMTLMEFATAVQEGANVNICIINNGYLGMVRQWQEIFYEKRYMGTPISGPDYVKLAEAYGFPGHRVHSLAEVIPAMRKAQAYNGPTLIEFVVEQHDMVYPMVSVGSALNDMVRRPYVN